MCAIPIYQVREGFRLVAPVLQPVEAVVGDQVGRIALDDAAPLLRDDVGVIIFALVVEHLPVVDADPGGRGIDMPFAEHRGSIDRLRPPARPTPDIVVERGSVVSDSRLVGKRWYSTI